MSDRNFATLRYKDIDASIIPKLSDKLIHTLLDKIKVDMANLSVSNFSRRQVNCMIRVRALLKTEQRARRFAAITKAEEKWLGNTSQRMVLLENWISNLKVAPPTKIPLLVRGAAKTAAAAHQAGPNKSLRARNPSEAKSAKKSKIPILCTRRLKTE